MDKEKIYFPNLTGLRFFAALSVLIYHFYGVNVLNAHTGVILFFVLSGFLITYLLLEEVNANGKISLKKFYVRRMLRIWPLYFLAIILGAIVLFSPFGDSENHNVFFKMLPYYLFFLPNLAWLKGLVIPHISVLWSVGSEEQFYLLWPLLFIFFRRRFLLAVVFVLIFFVASPFLIDWVNHNILSGSQKISPIVSNMMYYMSFNSMATGAIMAYLAMYHRSSLSIVFMKPVQLLIYLLTIYLWLSNPNFPYVTDQIFATLFGLIIVNLAVNSQTILHIENKWFNYLGKISYGIYVYHQFTFYFIILLFVSTLKIFESNSLLLFLLCVGFTIFVAALSYRYFETPFLNLKSRVFNGMRSKPHF